MTTNVETPAVVKLIEELKSLDIIALRGGKLNNVVFRKGDNEYKICNVMFFRTTGMSMVLECRKGKRKGEELANFVPITDDMFYQNIIKQDILNYFYPPKKNENQI